LKYIENNDNDMYPSYQPIHILNNEFMKVEVAADKKTYSIIYKKRLPTRAQIVFFYVGWGWRQIGVQWRGIFKITLQVDCSYQLLEIRCAPSCMRHIEAALDMYFRDWNLSLNTMVRLIKLNVEPCVPIEITNDYEE